MQYYNNTQINGTPMPLLMGFTPVTKIMGAENSQQRIIYDPISQTNEMDLRIIGTYSLKISVTHVGRTVTTDKKNEIDDQKSVL